jgi:hypothetical protein
MANTYTPSPQDLAAARLWHELNSPDEPFTVEGRSQVNYQSMRQWLKAHHWIYGVDGYMLQPTLPDMPEDRYVDPKG